MNWSFLSGLKPTGTGTLVPYHAGLRYFNTNKPCTQCGRATPLELDGRRLCPQDYKEKTRR